MTFWGPSDAFMRRETINTKLRPPYALFFRYNEVLHFISCFKTLKIPLWKQLFRDWILLVCISWMTEGPRVNFVMRKIYTWILCLSYLHDKQTSRIQSLYLYFIKIVPFWLWNIRFLIHNRAIFRTAAGAAGSYVMYVSSWKNGCQHFLMLIVAENTGSVNIFVWKPLYLFRS